MECLLIGLDVWESLFSRSFVFMMGIKYKIDCNLIKLNIKISKISEVLQRVKYKTNKKVNNSHFQHRKMHT